MFLTLPNCPKSHSWGHSTFGCPCDEQSGRQPARMTVRDNSIGSSGLGGTLSPSRIADLDVTDAPALSSGGPPSVPSRISVVLVDEAKAGGGAMPIAAPRWMTNNDVSNTSELSGGGGPRSVPSRISVVLVDGTKAGGTPGRECPHEDRDLRPLAGVTRPAGVSVCGGNVGSPCVGGTLSTLDVAERLLPAVPTGPPHQLVLLAQMARLLHGAPLAHVGRCLRFSMKFWNR